MKKLELNEIKQIELSLLIEFDAFCKRHNLYYVLCGGTLLGAIRHKGFIPWDDDIDVLMPRPDYERLMSMEKNMANEVPQYMKMFFWKNGTSNYPFIKWVDSRTQISEQYYDDNTSAHIWIDIFPIDGNPDDEISLQKLYQKSIRMRKLLLLKYARAGEGKTKLKKVAKIFVKPLVRMLNTSKMCQILDAQASTYDFGSSRYIGGVLWGYGPQERIEKEEFMKPVQVEFEGHEFNAPSNYDAYLRGLYKDYMKLPPKEKRVTHSYKAYIEENENI